MAHAAGECLVGGSARWWSTGYSVLLVGSRLLVLLILCWVGSGTRFGDGSGFRSHCWVLRERASGLFRVFVFFGPL
jgi:hypothetical protein